MGRLLLHVRDGAANVDLDLGRLGRHTTDLQRMRSTHQSKAEWPAS
jgi:hypothetical protein